jgi:hypothetical protein
VHEVIEAAFVEGVEIGPVATLEVEIRPVMVVTTAGHSIKILCCRPDVGIDLVRHTLAAHPGTRIVEAHGDVFALYDPAGDLPPERQHPWATVVTSDNPYDATSVLDRPDVFRLNLGLPKARFRELVDLDADHDPTAIDVLFPHPVYGGQHWLCVLNPRQSWPVVQELLTEAHAFAVRKYENATRRELSRPGEGDEPCISRRKHRRTSSSNASSR